MTLRRNPPTFIIWNDFSEDEWNEHEKIFRDGKRSGQRDIQKWYNEVTESGDYCLIGKYYIDYSDPFYIWKLKE